MEEIWKDVKGYEGYYQVSNLGQIRRVKGGMGAQAGELLKGHLNLTTGYLHLKLSVNSKTKEYHIHRLVAMTFIPNPQNKPCVNHLNGVKTDNRVENLEWTTYQENNAHAYKTGLHTVTDETRRKLSESNKGKHHPSDEMRGKMSESHKGQLHSEETRKKMSKAHKGRIWVNDGTRNYRVMPEKVQEYLNSGYILGYLRRRI